MIYSTIGQRIYRKTLTRQGVELLAVWLGGEVLGARDGGVEAAHVGVEGLPAQHRARLLHEI